jgi:5'-3' exonuclease
MKVHLVDGTYELFRSFYGAPSKVVRGKEVGATRGILRSLASMLERSDVTHVGCAFDHVIESFRNDLFAGYKTGDGIDPALWNQFELAERATVALGLVTWPMIEFEADDALATAAHRFASDPKVEQVVICTPDKDMAQCVIDDRVILWDRRQNKTYDHAGVIEKFGVPPSSIPDYLALVGDTSDGYPGIPRWGAKSAAAVLAHYGTVENIPDDAAKWAVDVRGKAALAENLASNRENVALFKKLATLRIDAPLAEDLEAMRWKGIDTARFEELWAEIDDDGVLPEWIPRPRT